MADLAFMVRHTEARIRHEPNVLRSSVPCRSGRVPAYVAVGNTVSVAFRHDHCQVYGADGQRVRRRAD